MQVGMQLHKSLHTATIIRTEFVIHVKDKILFVIMSCYRIHITSTAGASAKAVLLF